MINEFTGNGYLALPENLCIQDSPIHGQGVFAKEDIASGSELGECHVFLMQNYDLETKKWERKHWMRTSIGAFLNHDMNSNCTVDVRDNCAFLIATKDIKAGEEITVTYQEQFFEQAGL